MHVDLQRNLNTPGQLSAIDGWSLGVLDKVKLSDLLMYQALDFTVEQDSLASFYIELPKDVEVQLVLGKRSSAQKLIATSKQLNKATPDNFMKAREFKHSSIIQVREYLQKGETYTLMVRPLNPDLLSFPSLAARCDVVTFGKQIQPLQQGTTTNNRCLAQTPMPNKLQYGVPGHGTLRYDLTKHIADSSYITISPPDTEGPFLFVYQAIYDTLSFEGVLGIGLYLYEEENNLRFTEVQKMRVQGGVAEIVTKVKRGVYVLKIESMTSSTEKFTKHLFSQASMVDGGFGGDQCLTIQYSYYVTSFSSQGEVSDPLMLSFTDLILSFFSGGRNEEDKRKRREFDYEVMQEIGDELIDSTEQCVFDEMPVSLPETTSGYDNTYKLRISNEDSSVITLIAREDSLLKVLVSTKNSRDNINMFVYDSLGQLISNSKPDFMYKTLTATLPAAKKAYKLKIVYDTSDREESCPFYNLRLSLKPLQQLREDNDELKCKSEFPMVPTKLTIGDLKTDFKLDSIYQVSLDNLQTQTDSSVVIINLQVPQIQDDKVLFFDIETSFGFLLQEIADVSLYQGKELIGESMLHFQDDSTDTMTLRLKAQSGQKGPYTLKFTYQKETVMQARSLSQKMSTKQCFSFLISMRAQQLDAGEYYNDPSIVKRDNELIRVDWHGQGSNLYQEHEGAKYERYFDPRNPLVAILQFKSSISRVFKTLKNLPFVYLQQQGQTQPERLYPISLKVNPQDKSQIVLTFSEEKLKHGQCYSLFTDEQHLQMKDLDMEPEACMSKCACNSKGMKSCNEVTGVCSCHIPFTGTTCSQCLPGHIFNEQVQDCLVATKCQRDGGAVDCNSHGTCYYDTMITKDLESGPQSSLGQAKCECDDGFANDGLDYCGKCKDQMFQYPNCGNGMLRQWIIETTDHECDRLPTRMPTYLYQGNLSQTTDQIYQSSSDLHLVWYSVYRLSASTHHQRRSEHFFKVPTTPGGAIVRLFVDTHQSPGVKIRYSFLDNTKGLLYESESKAFSGEIYLSQLQHEEGSDRSQPFSLVINYEVVDLLQSETDDKCLKLEIFMIVQPYDRIQNYLKCSDQEISEALKTEKQQFKWTFGQSSYFFNQKLTIPSDMKPGQVASYIQSEDEEFKKLSFTFTITSPQNALSIITAYNFQTIFLRLVLRNKQTKQIVALQRYQSLEDVSGELQESMVEEESNMMSVIEMPSIDKGEYELEVYIHKFLFLESQKQKSCLNFDMMVEYIVKSEYSGSSMYEVIGIIPTELKDLHAYQDAFHTTKGKIEVRFNKQVDVDELMKFQNDDQNICVLQNKKNQDQKIYPERVLKTGLGDSLAFYFNFLGVKFPQEQPCYSLRCSTQNNLNGKELIRDIVGRETSYCFMKDSETEREKRCNPNAMPKFQADGKTCICTYPYKGETCEECENHYLKGADSYSHTLCSLDTTKCSAEYCSNHGTCQQQSSYSEPVCQCLEKFVGKNCQKCKDPHYRYPDCDKLLSFIDEDEEMQAHYQVGQGYSSYIDHLMNQCPLKNFPEDLDRIEFMRFMEGGDFHIADVFTVNHDKDNMIKFLPMKEGTIKIFIQQPWSEILQIDNQVYDVEIAIYDVLSDKVLAVDSNHELKSVDYDGKLDYATLQYRVKQEQLGKTLYILFRAENFTSTEMEADACLDLSIELQFDSSPADQIDSCDFNPEIASSFRRDLIIVDTDHPYHLQPSLASSQQDPLKSFSVQNSYQKFFFFQDFYLGSTALLESSDSQVEKDLEFSIGIYQKFTQSNLISFALEVLGEDITYQEAMNIRSNQGDSIAPQCKGVCMFSGEKKYNEVRASVEVSQKSLVRIWLFQSEEDGQCANYQLYLDIQESLIIPLNQDPFKFECSALDMPHTLNTDRYLGVLSNSTSNVKQRNFQYLEDFRIDTLGNKSSHIIKFELVEPTMFRLVALIHKHKLEYDIELHSDTSKILESAQKGTEDSLFAQLKPGKYFFRLLFSTAEAHLIRQPCQSIQVELEFTRMEDAKKQLQSSRSGLNQPLNFIEALQQTGSSDYSYQSAVKTFNLNNRTQMQGYQAVTELMIQNFQVLSGNPPNLGLQIECDSNFLTNDVSIFLSNKETKHIFSKVRDENIQKLVIEHLNPGTYKLVIYSLNSVSNLQQDSSMVPIAASFNLKMSFFTTGSRQRSKYFASLLIDEQKVTVPILQGALDLETVECSRLYSPLPEKITLDPSRSVLELNQQFIIPTAEEYEHRMEYQVPDRSEYSMLRIVLSGRSNAKIQMYQKVSTDALFESFATNNGEDIVLIASNLKSGSLYQILLQFTSALSDDELGICDHFRMHLLASDQPGLQCLSSFQTNQIKNPSVISITNITETTSLEMALKDQMEILTLNLDPMVDLITLEIDYSSLFFIPTVKLFDNGVAGQETTSYDNEVRPYQVLSGHKNLVKYIFRHFGRSEDGKPRLYTVVVSQINKIKGCVNKLKLKFDSEMRKDLSKKEGEFNPFAYFAESHKQFTSQADVSETQAMKLPVTLNSYKYLKQVSKPYLLITEYIEVSSLGSRDQSIYFTLDQTQGWNNTMIKVLIESNDVLLQLKAKDDQSEDIWRTYSLTRVIDPGSYQLQFNLAVNQVKTRKLVKVTIVLADKSFYSQEYLRVNHESLRDCSENFNLPLALSKDNSMKYFQDEQVYDYPLMRLGGNAVMYDYILDSFNFRVNQTSRFYFVLGSHLITSHAVLRITELRDISNAQIGAQSFQSNVLDLVIGPGDYQVQVEQPWIIDFDFGSRDRTIEWLRNDDYITKVCGLYSLGGRITPVEDLAGIQSASMMNHHMMKCPIKEVLPTKIYKSKGDTKNGLEYYITNEGTFSHYFTDLLIKSSQASTPIDRIEISPPMDGLVSLTVQYPSRNGNRISVKLTDAWSYTFNLQTVEHRPIVKHLTTETSSNIIEETVTFSVQMYHQYYLTLEYHTQPAKPQCDYFSAHVSFSSYYQLLEDTQCLSKNSNSDAEFVSTGNEVVSVSNSFVKEGYLEIRYPRDYYQTLSSTTTTGSKSEKPFMKTIQLNGDSSRGSGSTFDIEAKLKFDAPFSNFEFSLLSQQVQGQQSQDVVSVQRHLEPEDGDVYASTFVRELRQLDLSPAKSYQFLIMDKVSLGIMKHLQQLPNQTDTEFCLYSHFYLKVQNKGGSQGSLPLISSTFPMMESSGIPQTIIGKKKELVVGITFTQVPFHKSSDRKTPSEQDLVKLLGLQVVESANGILQYVKKPTKVTFNKKVTSMNQPVTVTVTFNIESEVKESRNDKLLLQVAMDLNNTVDSQGRAFAFSQDLALPKFSFEQSKSNSERLQKEAQKAVTQADKLKLNITRKDYVKTTAPKPVVAKAVVVQQPPVVRQEETKKKFDVKCLCVHGYCLKGESTCLKCDQGWTGTYCDYQVIQEKTQDFLPHVYLEQSPQPQGITEEPLQDSDSSFFSKLFNLILLLAACYGGFFLFTLAKGSQQKDQSRKKKLRYSDERDHEEAMELIELKHTSNNQEVTTPDASIGNEEEEDDAKKVRELSRELHLYASEDDPHVELNWGSQDSMLQPQSRTRKPIDDNTEDDVDDLENEIDQALQDLKEVDDDHLYQENEDDQDKRRFL